MMGVTAMPVMMLWCPELALGAGDDPCAAARSAPRLLTEDLIVKTGRIVRA